MEWCDIEHVLHRLKPTAGGYTAAKRGLLRLDDGRTVFVKIGVNENTNLWAAREIGAYGFLGERGYPFAPRLLATKPDWSGFAVEALPEEDGWEWREEWTTERVALTLAAMDELLALGDDDVPSEMRAPVLTAQQDGWQRLLKSQEQLDALYSKLGQQRERIGVLADQAKRSSAFDLRATDLVHLDVRADNCAWRAVTRQVRLVDWNWLHLGDRRIDQAATLTMMSCNGFDVTSRYSDRLDPDALHWLAGYWLEAASRPMWPGGPSELRDVQLGAGLMALELSDGDA